MVNGTYVHINLKLNLHQYSKLRLSAMTCSYQNQICFYVNTELTADSSMKPGLILLKMKV